jgi:hypothetical protein
VPQAQLAILGDVQLDRGSLEYRILAGTGSGSQGPGQGQKPLVRATGSGPGTTPQSRY